MVVCIYEQCGGVLICTSCGEIDTPINGMEIVKVCAGVDFQKLSRNRRLFCNELLLKNGTGSEVRPETSGTDCSNRGDLLRIEPCKPCQSGDITPEIFACAIHGECTLKTISKRKPDGTRWAACSACKQRTTRQSQR